MKYWKDCPVCNGKGYVKTREIIGVGPLVGTCPNCVNGEVDATKEIRTLQNAIEAAKQAIENAQYTEALNILDEAGKQS